GSRFRPALHLFVASDPLRVIDSAYERFAPLKIDEVGGLTRDAIIFEQACESAAAFFRAAQAIEHPRALDAEQVIARVFNRKLAYEFKRALRLALFAVDSDQHHSRVV